MSKHKQTVQFYVTSDQTHTFCILCHDENVEILCSVKKKSEGIKELYDRLIFFK